MKQRWIIRLSILCMVFALFCQVRTEGMYRIAAASLTQLSCDSEVFRKQALSERMFESLWTMQQQSGLSVGELLTVLYARSARSLATAVRCTPQTMERWYRALRTCAPAECARIQQACSAIWDDVSCFPVDRNQVQFENSWMFERTYGGLRGHEGTDLIPEENISGYYPVRSMTDGVVEQIGWLKLGGYRIGIRSTSGGYFYYAHLSGYADSFACGDEIEAGELLGYMGDTGYGPEGTTGQFPVHLHLGIYIATETKEEISVNPYWVLRYCIFTMNMLQ